MYKKCCMCGMPLQGFGNNPWGAINSKGETIQWEEEDRCCNECDAFFVIPGRIRTIQKRRA